jgi:hypothetical protein
LVRAGIGHGTEQKDSGLQRVANAASGVAYATLRVTAVKILAGASSSGGSNSPKETTGGVLDWTGGTEIVGVVGAILIGAALFQGYKSSLINSWMTHLESSARSPRSVSSGTSHGWWVFALIGYGFVKAAIEYDP